MYKNAQNNEVDFLHLCLNLDICSAQLLVQFISL